MISFDVSGAENLSLNAKRTLSAWKHWPLNVFRLSESKLHSTCDLNRTPNLSERPSNMRPAPSPTYSLMSTTSPALQCRDWSWRRPKILYDVVTEVQLSSYRRTLLNTACAQEVRPPVDMAVYRPALWPT
jgi:hypothetical protein